MQEYIQSYNCVGFVIRIPGIDKANEILGFKAKVDLEEGILKTAEWVKSIEK